MKYPKIWGRGPEAARIVGEARLRGLDQVGLPHLKASGPGFVAYKLGDTSEVHIEGGGESSRNFPYVLTHHAFSAGALNHVVALVGGERRVKRPVAQGYLGEDVTWFDSTTRVVHAGDGYYASTAIYSTLGGDLSLPHYMFGFAALLSGSVAYASESELNRVGKSVAFNEHAHLLDPGKSEGDPAYNPDHYPESQIQLSLFGNLEIFASGYDVAVDAYWFGWGLWQGELQAKFTSPDGNQTIRTFQKHPTFYRTHTKDLALHAIPAAFFPNQYNHTSQIFSMGPGKIGYLIIPKDFTPTAVSWRAIPAPGSGYEVETFTLAPEANPTLAVSSTHGQSWTTIEWSDLGAKLFKHKNHDDVPKAGRQFRNNTVESDAARFTSIHYVGDGKSFIVVHSLMEDQGSVADSDTGHFSSAPLRTMLFMYNAGAITRVAWPPDGWTGGNSLPRVGTYSSSVMIRAFGRGCLALPMSGVSGAGLLVTRDFGATWEQIELAGKLPLGASAELITLKPYVDASSTGEILFVFPSNGSVEDSRKGIHAYRTDGLFQEFKYVGRIAKNYAGQTVLVNMGYGYNGIYVGERAKGFVGEVEYPPYINPAFPGEFDRP